MADEAYLSYEQVLQELQINRSELNRLIRDGRLKDHVISGETKFRRIEVTDLKKIAPEASHRHGRRGHRRGADHGRPAGRCWEGPSPRPRSWRVRDGGPGSEPVGEATDVLEATPVGEGTDVLIERPSEAQERDTEVLEEEPELELELPGDQAMELEKPLAEATPLSESALETDLELQAVRGKQPQEEEEDFFDFTDALKEDDFELEGAQAEEAPSAAGPAGRGTGRPDGRDDGRAGRRHPGHGGGGRRQPGLRGGAAQRDHGDRGRRGSEEDTADITADITTMEEPTYEATELEDVLAGGGEEERPSATSSRCRSPSTSAPRRRRPAGWWRMLVITLVILIVAGLFVMDNSTDPGYTGGLTSWALKLTGA